MSDIEPFILSTGVSSVEAHIRAFRMDSAGTCGTEQRNSYSRTFADYPVYVYNSKSMDWVRYSHMHVDENLPDYVTQMALFIRLQHDHFEVVLSTVNPQ